MAESITFNNATYIIPDVGESSWGQNLTNFFVAIPQGCYQLSGGTAPLTADLSFGTNFGLFAKYLTSTTTHPSTTGVIRLANTEAVSWRNAANGADLALSVNTSNQLTFNGNVIPTDTTTITAKSFLYGDASGLIASTSNPTNGQLLIGSTGNIPAVAALTGTTHQVIVTNGAGTITLSTPQNIDTNSTPTFANLTLSNTTNQIVLGTTNTTTLSSTAPASSRTYTIPDAGGAANVVLDAGNYTIGGTWSFSNTITLASSKAVIFTDNTTNTVTLKATNSTTSWTLSLPTAHGSNGQFLQTDGSGNTTWANGGSGTVASGTAGNITLYTGTGTAVGDTYVQNSHNITLGIAAQGSRSANLALTIPNPGNAITAANVVLDQGAYTIAGAFTFSGGITMSGSTIAMGSNKITGLANGTASTDAAAFGQIFSGFQAPVQVTDTTNKTTSSSTFQNTALAATITPTSSSHRIKITISAACAVDTTANSILATVKNGTTNLGGTHGFVQIGSPQAAGGLVSVSFSYIDSPASASAVTYTFAIASTDNTNNVEYAPGTSVKNVIILEEIV